VRVLLESGDGFLSAMQEVVALGPPDLADHLREVAVRHGYSTWGLDQQRADAARLPTRQVSRVHFEDADGHQFERLVFAYLARKFAWRSIDWYGQVGDDGGRDIRGVREDGRRVVVACANRQRVTSTKFTRDLEDAIEADGVPDVFFAVCGGLVSPRIRKKIEGHARKQGVGEVQVWAGPEFEERLRADAEPLLKRFLEGVPFPEDPSSNPVRQTAGRTKPGSSGVAPGRRRR
jgi:hypothetical protein